MTLAPWVHDPGLAPVWAAARERLERNGIEVVGTVTVRGLDRGERHAVSGLLGRPVVRDSVRVELRLLDAAARQRSGAAGIVELVEAVSGPLRNRLAERSATAAAKQAPFAAARGWLARHPGAAAAAWVEPWLSDLRRSGLLTRADRAGTASTLMVRALEVTEAVLVEPTSVARTVLAARVAGDAHALDDGSVLAQLVLRALALAAGEDLPRTAASRRALWERHGVSADAVSATCLASGLAALGASSLARRLSAAADVGDPVHVTAWDLARGELRVANGTWVLVCENPRVLEAVAERLGGAVAVVCTSGMPGLVTLDVLRGLRAGGAALAYHGDFDWPGIAIANRLLATEACVPWRMSAQDYLEAANLDGLPLQGNRVDPVWDAALGNAMAATGTAVHEEAVLERLLADLEPAGRGRGSAADVASEAGGEPAEVVEIL